MNRSKRSIALFIALLITVFGVIAASFNTVHDANATGGSFPLTKHGGGTTDGVTPYDFGNGPGVDRAVNPDYGTHYNFLNPEAGKYKGGECTQCHEPHASFGGSEALPNTGVDAGPAPYLALKEYDTATNYASLCWYCHENFSNINTSGSPPGMGRWRFYQGKTTYMASSHYNSPNFYWPGTTGDLKAIWPRQNRAFLPAGNTGSCLNCHTPHGIKSADAATAFDTTSPDGSGGVPASMQTVASGNPSVNADYLIPRQLISWEETLCERCHDASGPAGSNIQGEINKRVLAGGSGHPVDDTTIAGRHVASESLPITTKHVECYDCHNPHAVKSTNRVEGMKYVNVNGTVQDPATGARQPYIYEVCFKCHGNSYNQVFAADTPFPDVATNRDETTFPKHFSNKRKEFDPNSHQYANYPAGDMGYNTSFHPVAAPGRNGTLNLCMQLQNAFGLDCSTAAAATASLSSLTIQCTDCHNNDMTSTMQGPATYSNLRTTDKAPKILSGSNDFGITAPVGPHGSAVKKLLRGNYLTTNSSSGSFSTLGKSWYWSNRLDTNGRPKFELCFLCHEERRLLGTGVQDPLNPDYDITTYTNFGGNSFWLRTTTSGSQSANWAGNLHMYHLNVGAVCHDCHHNVHSNVEAQNTIYGDGFGRELPPDNQDTIIDGRIDTHLLNFGPQASGYTSIKPRWFYDGAGNFRCNLMCHGRNMTDCGYWYGGGANFFGGGGICGG